MTISNTDNEKICERYGLRWLSTPNEPLGAKHNAAMMLAMSTPCDAVMILPSDDFVDPLYVVKALECIADGADYVAPRTCALYDVATGRACMLSQREPMTGQLSFGAGRVLSRRLVERIGNLWTEGKGRGLDTDSNARILSHGVTATVVGIGVGAPCLVDVKTDVNLWGFDKWRARGVHISADVALGMIDLRLQDGIVGRKNVR